MQAIHLLIGIVEGAVSSTVLFLAKNVDNKKLSIVFGSFSLLLAGVISNYASTKPDGLEWSLLNISDAAIENTQGFLYNISTIIQAKTSIFANYSFGSIAGLMVLMAFLSLIYLLINKNSLVINEK